MTLTPILTKITNTIAFLPNVGVLESDNDTIQLRKRFMNSIGLLMSMGGILWGGIALYFEAYLPAAIPLGYTTLTGVNLIFFYRKKNFPLYRFLQVLMSLLLPFLFQWSLGGLVNSGGVMLWSFLALVGSMSVQTIRLSVYWLLAYVVLAIFSGFTDSYFHKYSMNVPLEVILWFFVVNIVFISTIIFSLTLYYIHSRNTANEELVTLTNSLEKKVEERTHDLTESNDMLTSVNDELSTIVDKIREQNDIIYYKNKSITDSLNYARRIQRALLDNNERACHTDRKMFINFRPKDIVSGDFYWFHCDEKNERFTVAVVDCTGHGVPGAFMSLIGDSLLNQIVIDKGIHDPGQILHAMNAGIERSLKSEESNRRDGMDMAVMVMNRTRTVKYAGAKIPLVHICCDSVNVVKGSVHSIGGGMTRVPKKFETHTIELAENSMVYLFTDGFPDQLGGGDGRKYLTKRFREYLKSIFHLPVHEQNQALSAEFEAWRGEKSQTDDNLIVGLRF